MFLPTAHRFYFVAPHWDLTIAHCVDLPCGDGDTYKSWGSSHLLGVAREYFHERFPGVTSCAVFHSYVFSDHEGPKVYFRSIRFKTQKRFKLSSDDPCYD